MKAGEEDSSSAWWTVQTFAAVPPWTAGAVNGSLIARLFLCLNNATFTS